MTPMVPSGRELSRGLHPIVRDWFDRRTSVAQDWVLDDLLALKGDTRIAVVIPDLDEEETVGDIVRAMRAALVDAPGGGLVDDLVVLDSGSTDRTGAVAAAAGARVVHRDAVLPRIPAVLGKGEAMWRSLAVTDADIVVFVDADLRSFTPLYVTGMVGPLLADPTVALVKAMYERPLVQGDSVVAAGGGRVTEVLARPLLNLHWPMLAGIVQPLAGEYAARRSLLERVPFPVGYGVEFAILVDTLEMLGLDSIAQVDLGVRLHRHHDERRLGRMAAEILQTAFDRLDPQGAMRREHGIGSSLAQFERGPEGFDVEVHDVSALQRPPMVTIPEYQRARLSRIVG
jgi:glucosyl-3-phosphoglycerate synthase